MPARPWRDAFSKLLSTSLLAAGLCLAGTGSAQAGPVLNVVDGELLGARNVKIGDKYYDVRFVDGTCAAVFGACDTVNFFFKTSDDALLAAQALMNQVFLGVFDDSPELTAGCADLDTCGVDTPYVLGVEGVGDVVRLATANNASDVYSGSDGSAMGYVAIDLDLSIVDSLVWAQWSDAISPPRDLPEPGSLGITGLALAALAMWRRRRPEGR